jgi:hypothetical protein
MDIAVVPADESWELAKILEISIGLRYGNHITINIDIIANLR